MSSSGTSEGQFTDNSSGHDIGFDDTSGWFESNDSRADGLLHKTN